MAEQKDEQVVPSFDEGERKPSPITSTTDDGVRKPIPRTPVDRRPETADDRGQPATATMSPDQAGNPDRHTM